tara:strand:+ start:94135 stop:94653 length:519 start_codon:yes stop_codon:yes gene_type:complete
MLLKMFLSIALSGLLWPNHVPLNIKKEGVSVEKKYSAEKGKIGITMPGDYSVSESESESVTTTKVTSTIGDVTYLFSWTLHSAVLEDSKGLADVSLESFNEQVQGEILTQSIYKYGRNEGKSATVSLAEGQVNCFYRVILIDQYQFQMVVVTSDKELNNVGKRFLNSFKYKK